MKKFLLALSLLIALPVFATNQWPPPRGYVNDFAHVMPSNQSQSLELLLTEVEQKTGSQISVVTVPTLEGDDIDGAAVSLATAWGIGKKGKDNGILIMLSIQDRKDSIQVGYGLESVITDGETGTIRRQQMEPFFKQGNYGQGLLNGANAVAQLIAQNAGIALDGRVQVQNYSSGSGGLGFWGTDRK